MLDGIHRHFSGILPLAPQEPALLPQAPELAPPKCQGSGAFEAWSPLEDAWEEEDSERTAGLRRPYLSDAQLQAARIENCLHQKRSVHRSARVLQDSKPAGSKSACKPACSSPGCCSGCAV